MEKSDLAFEPVDKNGATHAEFDSVAIETDEALADFKRRERKVVAKLDVYIAPLLGLFNFIVCIYTFVVFSGVSDWQQSYIDRSNIGFAATQGMSKDIHLKGDELNVSPWIKYRSSRI